MQEGETRSASNKEGNYILPIGNFVYDIHNETKWYSLKDRCRVIPVGCIPNKEYKVEKHYRRELKYTDKSDFKRGGQKDFLHNMVCAFIAGLPSIKIGEFETDLTFIASDKKTFSFSTLWDNIKGNVRADVSFEELIVEVTRTSNVSTKKMKSYSLIDKPFLNIHIPQDNEERSKAIEVAIINGEIEGAIRLILENCSFAMSVSEWIRDIDHAREQKNIQEKVDEEKRKTEQYKHEAKYLSNMNDRRLSDIKRLKDEAVKLSNEVLRLKEEGCFYWVVETDYKNGVVYDSYKEKDKPNQVQNPMEASVFKSNKDAENRAASLKFGSPRVVSYRQANEKFNAK